MLSYFIKYNEPKMAYNTEQMRMSSLVFDSRVSLSGAVCVRLSVVNFRGFYRWIEPLSGCLHHGYVCVEPSTAV
jgi:hypothetical protein